MGSCTSTGTRAALSTPAAACCQRLPRAPALLQPPRGRCAPKRLGAMGLDRCTQRLLGEALVGSRLDHNAQAWLPLGRLAAAAHGTAAMALCRDIAGLRNRPDAQVSDAAVVVAGPFPTPLERISMARLRFLPRLLAHGPAELLALLKTGDRARDTD